VPEVISDTSPLQYLHQAKRLDLFRVLYETILVVVEAERLRHHFEVEVAPDVAEELRLRARQQGVSVRELVSDLLRSACAEPVVPSQPGKRARDGGCCRAARLPRGGGGTASPRGLESRRARC
jgi:hypothetical protein